ncbi:hypothetical protein CHELA41_24513 [Hyphomicrobiales bacterium]|nr:hypothetical protein CHELA41_24513 [Hyphomicrobiales bacterium]
MMRKLYKVYCPDWGEDDETVDDPFLMTAWSPDEAIEGWCDYGDRHGWFADGYPQDLLLRVVADDGAETLHRASTDWSPHFYFKDVETGDA